MNTNVESSEIFRTDEEGFPPYFATITVGTEEFTAPLNLLDLAVGELTMQGASIVLAQAIVSVGLKLYAHGTANLGYGIVATIRGQLGDVNNEE